MEGSGNGTVYYYLIDVHNGDYPKQTRYHRKNGAFPVQRRTDFRIGIQKYTGTFFPGNMESYSRLILMVAMAMHYILSYGSTTSLESTLLTVIQKSMFISFHLAWRDPAFW